MKETKNLRIKILLLSVSVYLMALTGCAYSIVKTENLGLPVSRIGESHPTKRGYECFSTGYIQEILKEIEQCK